MEKMISEERYSCYDYEIWAYMDDDYPSEVSHYYYKILDTDGQHKFWTGSNVLVESDDSFESAGEARLAAIGHISKLEDGQEPDYDKEALSIDWDERRKLGE